MSKHLEIERQAAAWLARKDGGRWSAGEQTELERWLGSATAHRVAYLRLQAAWSRADGSRPAVPAAVAPAAPPSQPGHAGAAAQQPAPARFLPRFSPRRFAAAILVTVGAGGALLALRDNFSEIRYETQLGVHQTHALEDGSKLTLNSATQVRARVGRNERTVWLDKGEAYFDVAHDPAHPFVVLAGVNRITVLGTRFAVRREAGATNVLVLDGRVQVENGRSAAQPPMVLVKRQKLLATPARMLKSDESDAGIEQALSWREGKLVFDQATLAYAAGEFNRYNKKKLVIGDAEAAKLQIGGRFDVGNVQGFASLLRQGFGLDVREAGDTIAVSSRRQEVNRR